MAFWDEGLQQFSGNRRYNDRINLTGMEFVLLRPDPVVEKQFLALDAWTRLIQAQNKKTGAQRMHGIQSCSNHATTVARAARPSTFSNQPNELSLRRLGRYRANNGSDSWNLLLELVLKKDETHHVN